MLKSFTPLSPLVSDLNYDRSLCLPSLLSPFKFQITFCLGSRHNCVSPHAFSPKCSAKPHSTLPLCDLFCDRDSLLSPLNCLALLCSVHTLYTGSLLILSPPLSRGAELFLACVTTLITSQRFVLCGDFAPTTVLSLLSPDIFTWINVCGYRVSALHCGNPSSPLPPNEDCKVV